METTPINIVILDNHALVRAGIRILLESRPGMRVIGDAGNLVDGLELLSRLKPDIVLFELNIIDQFTSQVMSQLVNASEASRLILVTGAIDPVINQQVVESGVMGMVLKSQTPETLIKAIEKVHSGEVWLERSMIANVLSRLSRSTKPQINGQESNNMDDLSDREKQIVSLIGQGYKNKKISTQLCISETTVRHHLTSIYSKLGVTDRLELLVFAHRYGLVKHSNL